MALPQPRTFGDTEVVFEFHEQMPTGVAVADDGRVFACYPKWGDDVRFTVAELRDGEEVAYPGDGADLVSVQSVVLDPTGSRLWVLDTASIEMQPAERGAPKLVCVDLERDEVVQTIRFPRDVALEKTYLNDVRFDWAVASTGWRSSPTRASPRRTRWGSSWSTSRPARAGAGSPVIRPCAPRRATWRSSMASRSTRCSWAATGSRSPPTRSGCSTARSRAAACTASASTRSPTAISTTTPSRRPSSTTPRSAPPTASRPTRTAASTRRTTSMGRSSAPPTPARPGNRSPISPRCSSSTTLAVAADRHVYFTVNQLHRQPQYQGGEDRREPPYLVMRAAIDAVPVRAR